MHFSLICTLIALKVICSLIALKATDMSLELLLPRNNMKEKHSEMKKSVYFSCFSCEVTSLPLLLYK